jgi:Rrf2 family protein
MLSTTSQYALRALVRLAAEPGGAAVLGRDLAKECDVPANYLSKLLWQLRNAGLVSTTRGSGGGYKLERPPGQIRLSDVVEVFEGLRNRPTCLLGKGECSDADACSAHHAWKNVRKTYIEFLDANTLADIAPGAGAGKAAALTAIR